MLLPRIHPHPQRPPLPSRPLPHPSHPTECTLQLRRSATISLTSDLTQPTSSVHAVTTASAQTPNLVREHMLGILTPPLWHSVINRVSVWAAICCLTCGVIAAILPLVIPSCQDVEHTCPNCTYPPPHPPKFRRWLTNLGGFLMARFRRGVDSAKVFPVDQGGYIAASQSGPQATPPVQFAQQSGIAEPAKK